MDAENVSFICKKKTPDERRKMMVNMGLQS
jgi:hypothetical protein